MGWPPEINEVVPNAHAAYGVDDKLGTYSLNLDHRDGGAKAGLFRSVLGLTAADVDYLARALHHGLASTPVRRVRDNPPHGVLCDVWITVSGLGAHADRTAVVRTAWEVRQRTTRRDWSRRTSGRNLRPQWRSLGTT